MKALIRSTVMAAAVALGAFGLGVAPVAAATVTPGSATVTTADTGFSWTVNFICSAALPCSGNPGTRLMARAVFKVTGVTVVGNQTLWNIGLVVRNTSVASAGGFLTALGFATDPDSVMGKVLNGNTTAANWSGGAGFIPGFNGANEQCVFTGNNCAAANNHSMTPGTQDRMRFTLTTGLVDALSFTDFAVKWAGTALTGGSYEAGGTVKVAPVPLPAAGGLLLVGLAGLVMLRRKQKAA